MLDWQINKTKRLIIRVISIILIQAFLVYDLAWAGAADVFKSKSDWSSFFKQLKQNSANQNQSQETSPQEKQTLQITIPQELGSIKETYQSKNSDKLIIHIQDAHADYEAQVNEAKIVDYLKDNYDIELVSVEGGFGDFDAQFFRSFPKDETIREKIAKYFLNKAFISGVDYQLITAKTPPQVFGAEDRDLYLEHLSKFRENQPKQESVKNYIEKITPLIKSLKEQFYSRELKQLDEKIEDFNQGTISLEEYLTYLKSQADRYRLELKDYPNLANLTRLQELEKNIDFKQAEVERQVLIDSLTKDLSKEDLSELVKKSLDFKANRLTSGEYYSYIESLTQKTWISRSAYNNLFSYIQYVNLSEKIDNTKVFQEIDKFIEVLKNRLFSNQAEKDIDRLGYYIKILEGLIQIKLSPKDLEYFREHKRELTSDNFARIVRRYNRKLDLPERIAFETHLDDFEYFYELALKRDNAIISNSLQKLDNNNSDSLILVAGGFHTSGIKSILKEKDISYVVIAPCIKLAQDKDSVYFSLLKEKKLLLDDVLYEPDTLQIINSISDPEARGLLITYWIARASRYYSLKELGAQLARLNISDDDQKRVDLALNEIAPATKIEIAKQEEISSVLTDKETETQQSPPEIAIPQGPTLFERFISFISSLKPKETKLAKQETIPTSYKEAKQGDIRAGKEERSSAPLPAQDKKASSPVIENAARQESIVNPVPVIPKGPTLIERFTGFIASLRPKPKPKKVETVVEGEQSRSSEQSSLTLTQEKEDKKEDLSKVVPVQSELTDTQKLVELFRLPILDDRAKAQVLEILGKVLKEENLSFILTRLGEKFLLVTRQLFLRPDSKAQDLISQFNLTKDELIDIYRILRIVQPLQDLIVNETEYAGFVNEMKNLLRYSDRLEKIFANQVVYPVIVEWHPGETCDSNCIFCYSRGMHYKDREQGKEPLSLERAQELLQEFVDNGVREFWISGGKEPLTNHITSRVIQTATDLGLVVRLYTNGIRLDRTVQERILGCKQVRISLNAATPEIYKQVQGINGENFKRVVKNISDFVKLKKQRNASVRIGMSFLLTPYNYKEIHKIAELAKELGVDFLAIRAEMVGTIRRFTQDEVSEILRLAEKVKIYQEIGHYDGLELDIRSLTEKDLLGEKHYLPDMEKAKTCKARMIKMGMSPYGVCYMCEYAEHPRNAKPEFEVGDVTKMSFKEVLERSNQIQHDPAKCEACMINEYGINIILEKLKEDKDFGISLEDQPYMVIKEREISSRPQLTKLQRGQRELLPQLTRLVTKGFWILTLSLSLLFFPQFSGYTFAQMNQPTQTQPYLNKQILNNIFSLSEEERTRIAPIINGIVATLNPDTKLPTSHLDDRSLSNWLLTYDAAAVAIELNISGKQKEAEQILDYFVAEYNRSLEEMRKKEDKVGVYGILRNFKHPFKKGQYLTGIINGIDSSSREGKGKDFSIHSGATAWLIMSMLQVNYQKYLSVAESLANVLLEFQDKDGGIITNPDNPAYKAAESHMDAVAAFKMLYQLTKKDAYLRAADKGVGWFRSNCINSNNIVYKGIWFGAPHNIHAADAYTWPLLIAGEVFTPEQIKQLISALEKRSLIEVNYTRSDGKEIKIITVDFTDPENSNIVSLRREYHPLGSTEWASGMALLYYQGAVLLWDSGDKVNAITMKAKGDALLYDAWQTGVTNYGMIFFPYATAKWIETGHGYKTPVGNQSMAGNWIIFSDLKFNPFILGGGNIKERLREIPSLPISEARSRLMLSVAHPAYVQSQQSAFPEHDYYQWYEATFAKYGRIDPEKVTNPYYFYKQGIEQEKAGKFEEASRSYEQALKIDSSFMDALQRIAELEYRQGKFQEANRNFQRLTQINSYNIEARIGYIQTTYLLKQISIAELEKEYKELLKRFPSHFGLLINLGEVVSWQGRYKEAIAYLRDASHIHPENPDVFRKLAEIARLDRDYDSAVSYYEEVIRRALDDAKSRFNMVDLKSKFRLMLYYGTMDSQGVFSVDKLNVRSADLSYRLFPNLTINTGIKELEIQGLTDRIISVGGDYAVGKNTKVSGRYSVNSDRNFYFRESAELGITKQISEGTTLLSGFTWMDFPDKDVYIFSPGILQRLSPKVYILGQYQYAMARDSQGHSILLRLNYEPIERLQLHVGLSAGEIESGKADFSSKAASVGIDYRINDRISIGAGYEDRDYRDFRDSNNIIIGLKIKFELLAKEFRRKLDRFGLSAWKINQILSYDPEALKVRATMPIIRLIAHIEGITVGMLLRRSLFHERLHDLFNLLKIDRGFITERLIAKFNKKITKYIFDTFRYEYGLSEDVTFEELTKEQLAEIVEELIVRYYTYKFQGKADFLKEPDTVEWLFRNFGFEIEEVMKTVKINFQNEITSFNNLHNLFDIEGEVIKEKQIAKLHFVTETSRALGGNPKIEFDYTREAKELEEEVEKIISSPIQSQGEPSSENGSFNVSSVQDIDNLFKTLLQNIMPHDINSVSVTIDVNRSNSDFLKYYLLTQMLRTAYFNWLKQYLARLNIGLDMIDKYVIEAILNRIILNGEEILEGKGVNIDADGNPEIEILRNGNGPEVIPLYECVWQKIIESKIGGLNGRSTFAEYLLRQVKDMLGQNKSGAEILAMVDQQHQFWASILRDQLQKYDKVRDEKEDLEQRQYLLINYEFDDLFRYCEDPVREFNINLNQNLDSDAIQQLVVQFKTFLDKHRKHLPEIKYPISLAGFYVKAISFIFSHWNKIFAKTDYETAKTKQAKAFWRNSILIWLGMNAVITTFTVVGILSVPGVFVIPFAILAGILILSFLPISYRAIVYVGRAYVAWREEKIKHIAVIKDWRGIRKRFDTLCSELNAYQQNGYFRLIDNLYDEYKLTGEERMKFHRLDLKTAPQNKEAQQRIKNWMNKFYQKDIPSIDSWQEVKSVTIQVASLDEKIFYHWDELISTDLEKGQIKTILNYLKKVYPDEWMVLIDRLGNKLTTQEKQFLLGSDDQIIFALGNPQAIREIEKWANLRLQTIFNTLESARKSWLAYKNLAKRFFPNVTDQELELLVSQKVQILFLHDKYPAYAANSIQKQDIDTYLAQYPFIQLIWQEDLIHQSKYGGWANALSKVNGEFLVTLDCDHSIRDEEIEFLPNALKEFTLNSNLAGIQFKVYVYNEPFSTTTKSVAIAENSWWGLDLRVKDKLGTTGLYGHLIFRTEFLKRFEGIQDDSVAEDILTSVRLLKEGFDTKYIEYMRIGKGFNVTHAGMSIPYRRYPMGAIESGLSKPFMEFLLSDRVSWDKKAETLFMASHYPTQPFIILATIAYIVGAYLLPFNPYISLPIIFFFLGLILAETINLGALLYMIENYGFLKGITEYLRAFPELTVFHVSFIPHYHERTEKALKGYAKFIVTRSSNILTHESWKTIYERNRFGFKLGAVLVSLIILTPFQGLGLFVASLLFILNSFIWLTAPFILNPARNKIEKVKDVILGPLWAFTISYYEMSIGALRKYLLLGSINRYLGRHRDNLPIDRLDSRFKNLLKRAVGIGDFNTIKALWNTIKILIKDAQGNDQKAKDSLKSLGERIDAVIKGQLEIEDLRSERLFENAASSPIDNKFITTQSTRGPPDHETRICLINLFSPTHPVLVRPLSIEALAGDLNKVYGSGVQVKLFDLQLEDLNSIVKKIEKVNPDIIGLSVKVGSSEQLEEILNKIKTLQNNVPLIVLGNILPTFASEQLLNKHKDVIIVIGEGELAMRGLVKKVRESSSDYSDVSNLAYIKDGEIIYTPRSALDLDEISLPSYDIVPEIAKRGGHIWLEASRGCNGHCTFCSRRPIRNKGWEPMPVDKVISDVRTLATQHKVTHFRFTDDDFMGTGSPDGIEHARKIAEGIKDLHITFDISARVDSIYSSKATPEENQQKLEVYRLLKEAGLTQVFLGIESGSTCQLKRFAKGVSVEENEKGIQLFKELGIQVVMGFITIDYLMGLEELKENIEFLEEMHVIDEDTTVFVSDPLTSLRAQEGCAYIKMLKNKGLLGPKDSSLVAYSASYKDARVGRIAYIINEWKDETYPLVYALKNRASLASLTKTVSLEAELLENYLYKFKQLDLDLLKQLVSLTETMDEFNIDTDKVDNLLNDFRQKRMEIIDSLLEEINHGRISDKEGVLRKEAKMIINKYRKHFDFIKTFKISIAAFLSVVLALFSSRPAKAENYQLQVTKLENWLLMNRDQATNLPHSHVGDDRFENWAITYDSAMVTLAYIATGRINDARRILDFYIQTPNAWRLGGIIEVVNPTNPVLGEDWSVRTGSNLWMGIASFHLYKATGEAKYLELAKKLADFAITLQNNNENDPNFRGIRLGPQGGGNVAGDQHLDYDQDQPSFYEVFATEHNIDAYALFNMLYQDTNDTKYKNAREKVLLWLKNVGYNKEEHRFNRGYKRGLDPVIATDIHSWGISALGVDVLDTFEPGLAEKMIEFIEKNCLSKVSFTKPNGKKVKVKGADFIDYRTAANLGRKPLVSPEWTFQLINAYRRLELDFRQQGNIRKEVKYRRKRQELIKNMLILAVESQDTLAYPYATQAEAVIGHEYNTPKEGNLSTIGVSYAILALRGFDPLIYPFNQDTKQIALNPFNFLPLLIGSSIFIQVEPFTNWLVGCLSVIVGALFFMFKNQISFKGEAISGYIYSDSLENITIVIIGSLLSLVFLRPVIVWLTRPINIIVSYFNKLLRRETISLSESVVEIENKKSTRIMTVEEVKDIFKEEIAKPSDEDIVSAVGRNATSRWYSAVRRTVQSVVGHPITVYYPGSSTDIQHALLTTDGDIFLFVDINEDSSKPSTVTLANSIAGETIQLGGRIINIEAVNDNEAIVKFEFRGRNRILYYYNNTDVSNEKLLPQRVKDGFDIYVEKALRTGYTGRGINKNLALPIALHYLRHGGLLLTDYHIRDVLVDSRLNTVGIEYVKEGSVGGLGFTHLTYFIKPEEQSNVTEEITNELEGDNPGIITTEPKKVNGQKSREFEQRRQETIAELADLGRDTLPALSNALYDSNPDIRNGAIEALERIGDPSVLFRLKLLQEREPENQIVTKAIQTLEQKQREQQEQLLKSKMPDPFVRTIFTLNKDGQLTLKWDAIHAINMLGISTDMQLVLDMDVNALIDTSGRIPQLKGYGFKETVEAIKQAMENKDIYTKFRIRLINLDPRLDREKIIRTLGLTEEMLEELVEIPQVPSAYEYFSIEPYLLPGSIRIVFEDNLRYWGEKIDVLVKRGQETEILSSLGIIVASLAKEPEFYQGLPDDVKDYIVAVTDEKGDVILDDDKKIKQLIFKPIEKTKVDTEYLERLNRTNKELEGNV